MSRPEQNKVLRVSATATVNARDYNIVLADATAAPITVILISPAGFGMFLIKVQNIGDGSNAVTVAAAGNKTITGTTVLAGAGAAAIYESDELGNFHVFGDSAGSSGGAIDGSGTPGNVPLFTGPTTIGDSLLNQSSGVVSVDADFGVEAASGLIINYGGAAPQDGELMIGDTAAGFVTGELLSGDGSVTITKSAGGIDLSVPAMGFAMETPTGDVDGMNTIFTFTSPPIFVTYQGTIQNDPEDYSLAGSVVTFVIAPVSGLVQGLITT